MLVIGSSILADHFSKHNTVTYVTTDEAAFNEFINESVSASFVDKPTDQNIVNEVNRLMSDNHVNHFDVAVIAAPFE